MIMATPSLSLLGLRARAREAPIIGVKRERLGIALDMTADRDQDLYRLLGVEREASAQEISSAYRRAARDTHPDSCPDEPAAGERFKAVSDAYETLRDPGRRRAYDQAHPAPVP